MSGRRLSEEENALRYKLYRKGYNDREIADKTGVSHVAIFLWRKRRNLPANNNVGWKKLSKEEENKRLELYKQGLSDGEIAKKLGISQSTIADWRKARGLKPNIPPITKKTTHKQKLELYNMGFTDTEIAKILNLNPSYVSAWRRKNNLKPNYNPVNEIDFKFTKEFGYFIGLVIGDGSIVKYKRWHRIQFSSPFKEYVDIFNDVAKALFPNISISRYYYKKENCYGAVITSKRLYEFLKKIKKDGDMWDIPCGYPDEFYFGLIGGLIDAEGWIYNRCVGIANKHKENLMQIKDIMKKLGIVYGKISIKCRENKNKMIRGKKVNGDYIYCLNVFGYKNLRLLLENCMILYKIDKFKSMMNEYMKPKYTEEDYNNAISLYNNENLSINEISKRLNIKYKTAYSWIKNNQKPLPLSLREKYGKE